MPPAVYLVVENGGLDGEVESKASFLLFRNTLSRCALPISRCFVMDIDMSFFVQFVTIALAAK